VEINKSIEVTKICQLLTVQQFPAQRLGLYNGDTWWPIIIIILEFCIL